MSCGRRIERWQKAGGRGGREKKGGEEKVDEGGGVEEVRASRNWRVVVGMVKGRQTDTKGERERVGRPLRWYRDRSGLAGGLKRDYERRAKRLPERRPGKQGISKRGLT